MATALAPRMVKALSMAEALVAKLRPGRSGMTTPIGPLKRKTGTSGRDLVQAAGSQLLARLGQVAISSKNLLMALGYRRFGPNQGGDGGLVTLTW